jgi:uracil phosphoribosyltransferase
VSIQFPYLVISFNTNGHNRDWGVENIKFVSILASREGLEKAAAVWPEGTDFVVGQVDEELDDKGYVVPGVGDIGDRLFGTCLK